MLELAALWHCPPDRVLAQDGRVLRLLDVYKLGHRDEEDEGGEDG